MASKTRGRETEIKRREQYTERETWHRTGRKLVTNPPSPPPILPRSPLRSVEASLILLSPPTWLNLWNPFRLLPGGSWERLAGCGRDYMWCDVLWCVMWAAYHYRWLSCTVRPSDTSETKGCLFGSSISVVMFFLVLFFLSLRNWLLLK